MIKASIIDRGKAMADQIIKRDGRINGWRLAGWGTAAGLLVLPFVAMQFTTDVDWSLFDFLLMGALLGSVGLAFEFLASRSGRLSYRAGAGVSVIATFLLIWINLAVGIIGSENNPANLMYLGVISVGIASAVVGGFRPRGMAFAMSAAALGQLLVAVIALVAGLGATEPPGPLKILALNGVFVGLWLISGWLFWNSVPKPAEAPQR